MFKFSSLMLCILFAITLATNLNPEEESKDRLQKAVKKCKGEYPDDKDRKSRIYCVSKIENWQHEDGSINKEVIRERAEHIFKDDAVKREGVYNDCTKQLDTPEDTAVNILTCYRKYVSIKIDI